MKIKDELKKVGKDIFSYCVKKGIELTFEKASEYTNGISGINLYTVNNDKFLDIEEKLLDNETIVDKRNLKITAKTTPKRQKIALEFLVNKYSLAKYEGHKLGTKHPTIATYKIQND